MPNSPIGGSKRSHTTRNLLITAVVIALVAAGVVAVLMNHKGKSTPSATTPHTTNAAAGTSPSTSTGATPAPTSPAPTNTDTTSPASNGDSDLSAALSSALAAAPLPGATPGTTPTGKPLPVTSGQWRLDSVTVSADPDSGEYQGTYNVTYLGQGAVPDGTLFAVGLFANGKDVGELDGGGSQSSSGNQLTIEVFSSDKYVAGPYTYYFYAG